MPTFVTLDETVASAGATWDDEINICTDGPKATSLGDGAGDTNSPYIIGTSYGFSIPTGATITGIEVQLYGIESPDGPNPDTAVLQVRIVKAGVVSGTNLGDNWTIPVASTNRSYGGESELWGLSWTPGNINGTAFGAALQVSNDRNDDVLLNSIRIKVYYVE